MKKILFILLTSLTSIVSAQNTGFYVNAFTGADITANNNVGLAIGLATGYKYNCSLINRVETEWTLRYHKYSDASVYTNSAMFNVYYEPCRCYWVNPYIGLGLGYVAISCSDSDWNFHDSNSAEQVILGVNIPFTWPVNIEYRFWKMGGFFSYYNGSHTVLLNMTLYQFNPWY